MLEGQLYSLLHFLSLEIQFTLVQLFWAAATPLRPCTTASSVSSPPQVAPVTITCLTMEFVLFASPPEWLASTVQAPRS